MPNKRLKLKKTKNNGAKLKLNKTKEEIEERYFFKVFVQRYFDKFSLKNTTVFRGFFTLKGTY